MKKAFSLVESSVVLLVAAILVAGVSQSGRLIALSRLHSARQITESSGIASIKDLSLWLEPTYEESFIASEQDDDGDFITAWYDTNPQVMAKNHMTKNTVGSARISYKMKGINDLPSVYFDGNTTSTDYLSGRVIPTPSNEYTLFLVLRLDDNTPNSVMEFRYAFINGHPSTSGLSYAKRGEPGATGRRIATFNGTSWNQNSNVNDNSTRNPEIITVRGNKTAVKMFVNGAQKTLDAPTGQYISPSGNVIIGNVNDNSHLWNGLISEVIFFTRQLDIDEINDVNKYLEKKYKIPTSTITTIS